MRPLLRVARAVLAVGGAAALLVPAFSAEPETKSVETTADNTFKPSTVTIKPGDSVLWVNNGGVGHTVESTSDNWSKSADESRILVVGQSTSYQFDNPGRYTYHCTTHPDTMKGAVVVLKPKASASPSPRPTATRTTQPGSSGSPSVSGSATPSPSATSGTPVASVTPPPSGSASATPGPTVAPSGQPSATVFLGEGGLTPQPPSGRNKGLPLMLALLLIGGVGSAELRALLANAPD